MNWFEKKYTEITEECETRFLEITEECETRFLECWSLLNHNLLPIKFYAELYDTKLYASDNIKNKINTLIVKQLLYMAGKKMSDITKDNCKQRWEITKENKEKTKTMSISEMTELKIGDLIDARDIHENWYVATVVNISETHIKIHFNNWDIKYDENINKSENRIAKYGTFTEKNEHIVSTKEKQCTCVSCKKSGNPHSLSNPIGLLMNLFGGNPNNISVSPIESSLIKALYPNIGHTHSENKK
jgi:hypothetical protein